MKPEPRWLPTGQACTLLGISRRTLTRMVDQGSLQPGEHYRRNPSQGKNPGNWRWQVNAIDAFLSGREVLSRIHSQDTTTNDLTQTKGADEDRQHR